MSPKYITFAAKMKPVANILSILFYPMFLPTYAIIWMALDLYRLGSPLPIAFWLFLAGGTFVFTCFIPLTTTLLLMRQGRISDIMMENSHERNLPYLYSLASMIVWVVFFFRIHVLPRWICYLALTATLLLFIVFLINLKWKISIHMTTMGAFVASVLVYAWVMGKVPILTFGLLLLLSFLLMSARLYLKAHTPAQVVAGFFLGFFVTFGTVCLLPY